MDSSLLAHLVWGESVFGLSNIIHFDLLKKKYIVLKPIIKYETTPDKIKICEKLLKSIKYGYLKVNFIL